MVDCAACHPPARDRCGMSPEALDLTALQIFFRERGIATHGDLHAAPLNGGRSNLTYRLRDERYDWVVRRPPTGGLTPSAHDMAREWTVALGLQDASFPVPRPVVADLRGDVLGFPFTVVEYVPGRVVRRARDLEALADSEVEANARALVSLMADLHAVDYNAVGLGTFGRPEGFAARQVQLWTRQWKLVRSRDIADVDRLARLLAERVPASSRASIVHGDLRVDNTILDPADPAHVLAVVDWEMSTLGDPLTDLALLCAYRDPNFDTVLGESAAWTSPRYPTLDQLAQWYATTSGHDLADWNFYLGLAYFKLGVVGEGIAHRARLGAAPDPSALAAGYATPSFIAAGLRALSGGC